MTTRPGAVALRSVDKSFTVGGSEVAALRDVSLDVAPGEFVSLVGPSGCGKFTLLRLVAGLERPDEGMVRVDDQPILAPSLSRGVVFQDHRLFPWMTVEANVLLALHRSGLAPDGRRERARALIALVGLGGFEDAHPDQLSGGMAQRAAIARSLAPRPRSRRRPGHAAPAARPRRPRLRLPQERHPGLARHPTAPGRGLYRSASGRPLQPSGGP